MAMPLFSHCWRNASLVRSGLRKDRPVEGLCSLVCVVPLAVACEEELASLVGTTVSEAVPCRSSACEEELASLVRTTVSDAVPCRSSHFAAHSAATSLTDLHVRCVRFPNEVTSLRVGTPSRFASSIKVVFRMDAKSGDGMPPSNGYCRRRTVRSRSWANGKSAPCRPTCKTLAKLGDGAPGIFRRHIPASYLRPSVPPPYVVHCLGLLRVRAGNTRDDWWYFLVGMRYATPASGSPCRRGSSGASPLARSGFHARGTIARNVWLPLAVILRII